MNREYIPYFKQVDAVLSNAIKDIIQIFRENNVTKIHLQTPVDFDFDARFAGDEPSSHTITDIALDDIGLIMVFTEDGNPYYLYNLSNKQDITFIYDLVYDNFYDRYAQYYERN